MIRVIDFMYWFVVFGLKLEMVGEFCGFGVWRLYVVKLRILLSS